MAVKFELTKEYFDQLHDHIENSNEVAVFEMVKDLHPADIAEIYDELNVDEARYIHVLLDPEVAAEVLVELE
ncbi:MAG: magnesium transporter, partial [Marinilabiliales bacterium]